jgi:hypothetical protein
MVNDETVNANNDTGITNSALGTNTTMDPDLNPLDNNNDDLLPDGDDATQGTALDPAN